MVIVMVMVETISDFLGFFFDEPSILSLMTTNTTHKDTNLLYILYMHIEEKMKKNVSEMAREISKKKKKKYKNYIENNFLLHKTFVLICQTFKCLKSLKYVQEECVKNFLR